jgi:adenylate kinase family enzyme
MDGEISDRLERVVVIGTSGSGKTTFARVLAQALGLRHVELDALYWGPDWTPQPTELFRQRVVEAAAGPRWVIDGNYSAVRELIWPRATAVVWLNYPLRVNLVRILARTFRRALLRERLWHGNRESLRRSLLSRGSILLWVLQTHGRRRREYPELLRKPEHAHLAVVELRSPGEAEAFLRRRFPGPRADRPEAAGRP